MNKLQSLKKSNTFSGSVTYDSDTIYDMTLMAHKVYHERTRSKIMTIGLVLIFFGGLFYGLTQSKLMLLPIIIGCWVFTSINSTPKDNAKKVVAALNNTQPVIQYLFYEDGFDTSIGEEHGHIKYKDIDKIAEDENKYYIFLAENVYYALFKNTLTPNDSEIFEELITNKTGLTIERPSSYAKKLITFSPLKVSA